MRVEIDLLTGTILRYSPFLPTANNIFGVEDGVPIDFDIMKYDYIQPEPNVFNPNGFFPKSENSTEDEKIKRFFATVNTSSNGLFTVTFPQGFFTKVPYISATPITTNTRVHALNLRTKTINGCTGVVKRSRLLPSTLTLLTSLQSYDVFQDPGIIQVDICAFEV